MKFSDVLALNSSLSQRGKPPPLLPFALPIIQHQCDTFVALKDIQ